MESYEVKIGFSNGRSFVISIFIKLYEAKQLNFSFYAKIYWFLF